MRGLRIAAVAVALAAGVFVAARGCGDDGVAPPRPDRVDGEAGDDGSANRDGGSHRSPRVRAVRPPVGVEDPDRRPQDDAMCRLCVRVLADPERTPLAGARVVVLHQPGESSAITDADGYAVLDVRRGVRTGRVEFPGRTTTGFAVHCKAERVVNVVHLPAGARLEGRVSDAATGRPLSGVRVALFSGGVIDGSSWGFPAESPFAEMTSDDDGRFGIDGLAPAGAVTLESTLPGRARNRTSLLLGGPGLLRAEIAMEPGGSVTGVVGRADGTPFPGAVVSVGAAIPSGAWFPGHAPLHARTGADGAYRVEGLDLDGVYVVECCASPVASATATGIRPTAAVPEVRCDLTFAPTGALRIELTGTRADQDDSVHVFTVLAGMHDTELGWVSDGDPRELTPRRLRAEWNPEDGHPAIVREVEIRSGVETVVRIERPPVHRVVGRILDTDGRPFADTDAADVSLGRLVGDRVESPEATFFEDGTFVIEDVAAGAWTLKADLPEHPTVLREIVVPCEPLVVAAPAAMTLRLRLPDGLDGVFVRWAVEVRTPRAGGPDWESWNSGSGRAEGEPFVEGPPDGMGPTRLRVAVPGFRVFEQVVDVEPGSHHDVVAGPLVPCGTLSGRVVDGVGRPVAGADVAFEDPDRCGDLREIVESQDDGKFADLTLPAGPGPRVVLVTASGFADRRVEFAGDVPNPLEVVLSRPGHLLVRARDGTDAPAVAREVQVLDAAGRAVDLSPSPFTDHRGRAEFRVPPGKLRVTVGGGASVAVDVAEEGTATIDVVVP